MLSLFGQGIINKKVIAFILLFFIAAFCLICDNGDGVSPHNQMSLIIGETVEAAYKETLKNTFESISLSFDSLVVDSRCPIGVLCIWEGDAELIFTFSKSSNNAKFSLHTHESSRNDTTAFGYNIELIDVRPYPHIDSTYVANNYSALVLVSK